MVKFHTAGKHEATGSLGTIVVLAIGLQLLLSGASLAAVPSGDPLDRTGVRRLSDSVAQALREISVRTVRLANPASEAAWSPDACEPGTPEQRAMIDRPMLDAWLLSLPPPATV
jgi:hypothetical protein